MTNTDQVATGYIVYQGASMLTGEPIVAIVTMKTINKKTGAMAQLWILRSDMHPVEALTNGSDEAICGGCQFRKSLGGACYVNVGQAPGAVYRKYVDPERGYPVCEDFSVFEGIKMRFGAYGDPAAIPVSILTTIKGFVKNNTSYTHQWKDNKDNEALKQVSMASVDNVEEAVEAIKAGYRTFRVTNDINTLRKDEIVCPNDTHGTQCSDCGLCGGTSVTAKNIVIGAHGTWKKNFEEKVAQ